MHVYVEWSEGRFAVGHYQMHGYSELSSNEDFMLTKIFSLVKDAAAFVAYLNGGGELSLSTEGWSEAFPPSGKLALASVLSAVADALGTEEDGADLVKVATLARRAEQRLADLEKRTRARGYETLEDAVRALGEHEG